MKNTSSETGARAISPISRTDFLSLLRVADVEWEGMMMFGRYCGLRLMDCARLRFRNLSRNRKVLRFAVPKQGSLVQIPLGPNLTRYLLSLPAPPSTDALLFPRCFSRAINGNPGRLVADFSRLLGTAGLEARGRRGILSKRVGFHSLRFVLPE
jgi:integrase